MKYENGQELEQLVSGYNVKNYDDPDIGHHIDDFIGPVILTTNDPGTGDQYRQIIEFCGLRVSTNKGLDEAEAALLRQFNASAVLAQIDSADEITSAPMTQIGRICNDRGLPLVLIFQIELLDEILETINCADVEHIILNKNGPQKTDITAEIIIALPRRIQRGQRHIFGNRDEVDLVDLKKISADVERIAKALNELSAPDYGATQREAIADPFLGRDEITQGTNFPGRNNVADVPLGFNAQNKPDQKTYGFAADSGQRAEKVESGELQGPVSARQIRDLIKARRLRDQYFDAELFADPAWDMLLDLMAARLEGVRVSVSSLCIAASVPPTTALRWIKTMTEEKIFERRADEKDGRRIFIELSDESTAGMIGFFSMIRRSKLMMI
ncbi:hypothetical protein [Parasphingorhabdus halotolerans]|uniref:hypothetical protein n=1 Tax=Parasphingorhabdus halotolerans TaxID=2725558 RepID=UPI001FE776B3|nr:hypothetical protein [Parasphingorhabdus halotolerans]